MAYRAANVGQLVRPTDDGKVHLMVRQRKASVEKREKRVREPGGREGERASTWLLVGNKTKVKLKT